MFRYVNAYTARGDAEPAIHASHHPPVPIGAGGRYRALCGRFVRNVTTVAWDPRGPGRRCPECLNDTVRRAEDDDR